MTLSKFNLILLIALAAASVAGAKTLPEMCQPISEKFIFHDDQTVFDFNLENSFKRGRLLGQGSFGIVRSIDFGLKSIAKAAVKEIKNDELAQAEVDILIFFSDKGIGSKFYGCQFNEKRVLIAEERLFSDMAKESKLLQFRQAPNSKFVGRIKDVVDTLLLMEKHNILHSDIKEDNVMTDEAFSKFTLIDFGLTQPLGEKLKPQGSPIYMSPGKWAQPTDMASVVDDLYSVGIMAGVLNNDNGFSAIYKDYSKKPEGEELPLGCFRQFLSDFCQKQLRENVVKLLSRANFGNYHKAKGRRQLETVNFTTLMAMMVEYYDFPFTLKQISDILARHIQEFEALEAMKPESYVPQQKDKTYGRNDVPDRYDFGRKFPRVHPDDLKNYELKFELSKTLELQIEKEKDVELAARLDLLKAKNEKEKVKKEAEVVQKSQGSKLTDSLAKKIAQSVALVDKKKQEYKTLQNQVLEVANYQQEYHKKGHVQDEVVKALVGEAALKINSQLAPENIKIAGREPAVTQETQNSLATDLPKDQKNAPAVEQKVLAPVLDLPEMIDLNEDRPTDEQLQTSQTTAIAKYNPQKNTNIVAQMYRHIMMPPMFGYGGLPLFGMNVNVKDILEKYGKSGQTQKKPENPPPEKKFANMGLNMQGKLDKDWDIDLAIKKLREINGNPKHWLGTAALAGYSAFDMNYNDDMANAMKYLPGRDERVLHRQLI